MTDLIRSLTEQGFAETGTGGGCAAMVRYQDGKTDVITSSDGPSLPEADDWLFVTYDGEWLADADCPIIESVDSESSPLSLLEILNV